MSDFPPVGYARCCRTWPVFMFYPLGWCGLCGARPTVRLDFRGKRVMAEKRDRLLAFVLARMPDPYPDSFAAHIVDKFLDDGSTDTPLDERLLQLLVAA